MIDASATIRIRLSVIPGTFSHYADYLLGERVWKLTAKGPDGAEVSGPNWAMLLTYEQEIRAHAANLMQEADYLQHFCLHWLSKCLKIQI